MNATIMKAVEFVKNNKTVIIKKGAIALGTAVGLALVATVLRNKETFTNEDGIVDQGDEQPPAEASE